MCQLDPRIQIYLFQIINNFFDGIVLKSSFSEFKQLNVLRACEKIMTFKKKMLDSNSFITSYTERDIVIREEIRVGNLSVRYISLSGQKKNNINPSCVSSFSVD
jgi:hypothetical protein